MVKKNSIPDGWRTVTPIGHPVPGTRFIAFKVPLKGAVNQRLTPTQKFTPKDLISAIKALNVELGLIIDLTYTTRYYEVKDLPKSIHYKKLYTVGLEVPDNATILQFKKWVRKFLWENAENGKLIGVHCTNGINRTGYLICRYLIDVEGWDPDTAIQAFGEARGHRINGCVYLKDLKTRPMRSNLGMDVWYSDEDANLPSNSVEDSEDWSPNEDFHGTGKRSRHLNDQHPRNDTQCYGISREETDFNKIQGTRPRPFHDHQCHSGCHEPDAGDDFDFVSKVDGQRRHSIQKHQAYSNCWEQFPTKDFGFTNRSWEQKRQPFSNNRTMALITAETKVRERQLHDGKDHIALFSAESTALA
ncbi:RNA/RNP complex-1-interacting phosphatase-like isoform X1 [Canis aureus]